MSQERKGYRSTFAHDSLLGWLNLLKYPVIHRKYMKAHERPPYPIIIDQPNNLQVMQNLNRADLGFFLTYSVLGFFMSRWGAKRAGSEYLRQRLFQTGWFTQIIFASGFALMNSMMRLQGLTENGLQWRRKDDSLNKYDFTSQYEENTIWKFFRIRDI